MLKNFKTWKLRCRAHRIARSAPDSARLWIALACDADFRRRKKVGSLTLLEALAFSEELERRKSE